MVIDARLKREARGPRPGRPLWTTHERAPGADAETDMRLGLLFEHNPQPMWMYDAESLAFVEANQAAISLYGYSRDEFLSMTLKDIQPSDEVRALECGIRSLPGDQLCHSEGRHRLINGRLIDVR